jgi:CRISPR-associated protein Cas1
VRSIEKNLKTLQNKLTSIEGKFSNQYFTQMMQLFAEPFRPEHRRTFKAYDGLNNLLNLAYRILFWKVHMALIKAKLEPYLGFLHSVQWGTPSLVCDFQELSLSRR